MINSTENRFKGRYPDTDKDTGLDKKPRTSENEGNSQQDKEKKDLKRLEGKTELMEKAAKNPNSVTPAEMKKLKEKLPGFIKLIKTEMQGFKQSPEGLNEFQTSKYKSLEKLLAASESMMKHFETENKNEGRNSANPESEEKEMDSSKEEKKPEERRVEDEARIKISENEKTAEGETAKLEKFATVEELVRKYIEKTDELKDLISQIDQSNIDVKTKMELESRVQALLKEIEDLTEQFMKQPEDQTTQDYERAAELEEDMQALEQQIGTDPDSPESRQLNGQLDSLKSEYQKIQTDLNSGDKNIESLNAEVNNSLASVKEPRSMNPELKTRVAQVLNNSGTDFKEKFRKIMEANQRTRSIK